MYFGRKVSKFLRILLTSIFLSAVKQAFDKFKARQDEVSEENQEVQETQKVQKEPDISELTNNVKALSVKLDNIETLLKDWGVIKNISKIPDLDVKLSYPIGYETTETTNQK